jgi:hypothetical protein
MKKILGVEKLSDKNGGLYVCTVQYDNGSVMKVYLSEASYRKLVLEEKLRKIDPKLVDELEEVLDLTIQEQVIPPAFA